MATTRLPIFEGFYNFSFWVEPNAVSNCQNPTLTQLNSKQLYITRVDVRHNSQVTYPTSTHHPHTNFSAPSRHARKLKFGTDTH